MVISLSAAALAGVVLSTYGMYRHAARTLNEELNTRIQLAAEEAARLAETGLMDGTANLNSALESVRRTSQLENLLVFDRDRRSLADARPRVVPGTLYTYLQLPPTAAEQVAQGASYLDDRRPTESLSFRSAAVPLRHRGELAGGVYAQASIDFEKQLLVLRDRARTAALLSVVTCLMLVIALLSLYHRSNRMKEAVQRRSRLELIHRLSAGIAHDIKNPLTAMMHATEQLEEKLADRPELDPMVTYLRKGSARILEITENLLGTGKGMERHSIDVAPFLRDLVSQSMPTAIARGARIETVIPDNLVVVAPATPLRMTVVNILQNAIEAVPMGAGRVHISARHDNSRLGLAISDNGPGIPRALRRKIFDPLVTTKADGSGLGLPVARQLIEDMKGSLELESVPGAGTTFIVWLPTEKK